MSRNRFRRPARSSLDSAILLIAALIAVATVSTGCGYRSLLGPTVEASGEASGKRDRVPTRIAVLALRNDSPEPWLDRIVSDAMRREMSARGGFDLVDDPGNAELLLRGRIRPLDINSRSFSRFVAALEYALTLQLDLELVFESGYVVRLDPKMLSERDVYLASADIEVTRTNRLEVLRRLADVLASRVADSIEVLQDPVPRSERADAEGGRG